MRAKPPQTTTTYPNTNDIPRLNTCVHDAVVRSAEDIRQIEGLLIGHIVRDGEQVDVALRDTNVLCLSACEATGEVRVAEETRISVTVHGVLQPART